MLKSTGHSRRFPRRRPLTGGDEEEQARVIVSILGLCEDDIVGKVQRDIAIDIVQIARRFAVHIVSHYWASPGPIRRTRIS